MKTLGAAAVTAAVCAAAALYIFTVFASACST